jgi:hypothetical protein
LMAVLCSCIIRPSTLPRIILIPPPTTATLHVAVQRKRINVLSSKLVNLFLVKMNRGGRGRG